MTSGNWAVPVPCSTQPCQSHSRCGQCGTPLYQVEGNGSAALWFFGAPSLLMRGQRMWWTDRLAYTHTHTIFLSPRTGHAPPPPWVTLVLFHLLPGPALRLRAGLRVLSLLTPYPTLCRRFTPTPGGWPSLLSSEEVLASALSSLCLQGAVLRDLSGRPQRRWVSSFASLRLLLCWPADTDHDALV